MSPNTAQTDRRKAFHHIFNNKSLPNWPLEYEPNLKQKRNALISMLMKQSYELKNTLFKNLNQSNPEKNLCKEKPISV